MATQKIPSPNRNGRAPVFVSYRHIDGTKAMLDIRRLLHTAGIPTWIDQEALWAGNITNNIKSIIEAGASGAVVVLTPKVAEPDNFVLTHELPAFRKFADSGFFIAIVNTVTLADKVTIDATAPKRLLGSFWDGVLEPQYHYTIDTPEHRDEFVKGILGTRCLNEAGEEVRIAIQSRVHSQGGNPDDCDLDFRIDTDERDVAHPDDLAAWARGAQLASGALPGKGLSHIRLSGGAQTGLAAAFGTHFPRTRFGSMTIFKETAHGEEWPDGERSRLGEHNIVRSPQEFAPGRGDVAVLVRLTSNDNDAPFDELVNSLPLCASYLLQVTPGTRYEPSEGDALAERVREELKGLTRRHGGRVHLCLDTAFPVAVQIGRRLNTFETVLYDLAKIDGPGGTERHYVPVAIAENRGGEISPVRPVKPGDLWPEADSTPLTLVNHTPHDVTLYRDKKPVITWPAVEPMARMQENIQQGSVRRFSNGTDEVETPIDRVSYGAPENLPPAREGVGYIVSRVLAEKVRRPDLFFPSREERDEKGNIIGCRALGQFLARIG